MNGIQSLATVDTTLCVFRVGLKAPQESFAPN